MGARPSREPKIVPRRSRCRRRISPRRLCLHQLGKTAEAKNLLVTGPVALLKEPIYYYNMGCYEALLGNVHDAEANLQISFKMDSSFRDLAKKDPDLKALHAVI